MYVNMLIYHFEYIYILILRYFKRIYNIYNIYTIIDVLI
jgi:hypothetical protein